MIWPALTATTGACALWRGRWARVRGKSPVDWPDFHEIGLVGNLAAFAVATAVVWLAGDRLARYGEIIADRTRLGQAFIGTLLLGVTVSLPEMTLSAVAAALGNAELAVNSILGGIGMVMVALAITDLVVGEEPLSVDVQHPVVLLGGAMVIMMLTVTGGGIAAGDRLLPGVGVAGAWTTILAGLFIASVVFVKILQRYHPWTPDSVPEATHAGEQPSPSDAVEDDLAARGLGWVICLTTLAAAGVFVAGTVLALSADALAVQTGLGAGFIGLIFGGIATSLPELSTTISAVRLKQYEMTFSDAWGTNLTSLALLLLADILYEGGPILNEVGRFSIFAVLLGTGLTTIYLAGLVARPERAFLRMGVDSVAVLVVSTLGFVILYQIK
jgi:cation:H+ antiporter